MNRRKSSGETLKQFQEYKKKLQDHTFQIFSDEQNRRKSSGHLKLQQLNDHLNSETPKLTEFKVNRPTTILSDNTSDKNIDRSTHHSSLICSSDSDKENGKKQDLHSDNLSKDKKSLLTPEYQASFNITSPNIQNEDT